MVDKMVIVRGDLVDELEIVNDPAEDLEISFNQRVWDMFFFKVGKSCTGGIIFDLCTNAIIQRNESRSSYPEKIR